MLKVDIQSAPPVVTLACSGRLVLGVEVESLRGIATARPERHLRLDLSRVHGIDAAGLGLLVELNQWAQQRTARLSITNPSSETYRLITLTRLDRVLHLSGVPMEAAARGQSAEWQGMTA